MKIFKVRASNMQELIYKRGQAGVNRPSVTMMFNNEDKDNSPELSIRK